MGASWVLRMAVAVAVRPRLWWVALRQAHRMAGRRWWARPPFLPVPAGPLAAFRATTQYGRSDAVPTVDDVLVWLEWSRRFPG